MSLELIFTDERELTPEQQERQEEAYQECMSILQVKLRERLAEIRREYGSVQAYVAYFRKASA